MKKTTYILGIFCHFHDASACLLKNGVLQSMAEEERFNREKHTPAFPKHAINFCLTEAGIHIRDVDQIAYGLIPSSFLTFQLKNAMYNFPSSLNLLRPGASYEPLAKKIKHMLTVDKLIANHIGTTQAKVAYVGHHDAHAFSAYFPSPFEEAAVMVIDGFGETESTTFYEGKGSTLKKIFDIKLPHSLGVFYGTITQLLGFRPHSDEYKVMGMAAYGENTFSNQFNDILQQDDHLGFKLDMRFFRLHTHGIREWYSPKLTKLLCKPRKHGEKLEQIHFDIAHSAQKRLEDIVVNLARRLKQQTKLNHLCISGGVGQNVLMNQKIAAASGFKHIFVPPFCYDGGISLGAALVLHHSRYNGERAFCLKRADWGPEFSNEQIIQELNRHNLKAEQPENVNETLARFIANGKIVAYFQGRMEVGPRALGFRSILADPRHPKIKDILNARVKNREFFRPFAPVITKEDCAHYFDLPHDSPFMTTVGSIKDPTRLPGIAHNDGTARVQTVEKDTNAQLYGLLQEFKKQTGLPILINTSFNENEPIVCTPKDAIACFKRTNIDVLAFNHTFVISKSFL